VSDYDTLLHVVTIHAAWKSRLTARRYVGLQPLESSR
jgi:hypothetical protein